MNEKKTEEKRQSFWLTTNYVDVECLATIVGNDSSKILVEDSIMLTKKKKRVTHVK